MSLLSLYDPVFPVGYLLDPPYSTAEELAETIQEAIDKAETLAEDQFNELQRTNGNGYASDNEC